jgi:hypothetical protein
MIKMDALSRDRIETENKIFAETHGLIAPEYEYPEEYHCWVCDALKSSPDAACSCDRGHPYGPDE